MEQKKLLTILALVFIAMSILGCRIDEDEFPVEDRIVEQQGPDSEFGADLVAVYNVSGNQISQVQIGAAASGFYNSARQQQFWTFFSNLIPADLRPQITRLTLYADDRDGTAAYVAPLNDKDLSKWEMGWNLAYVWDENDNLIQGETAFTAIHEFAHVLTLHAGQINVSEEACNSFHTGEGCSRGGSYINGFFENYWTDIFDEHQRIGSDHGYVAFYRKYRDRFITEYAATNPGEDIAETFSMFVVEGIPNGGSIARQKIRYLAGFDELMTIRERIRRNINFDISLNDIGEARSARAGLKESRTHY